MKFNQRFLTVSAAILLGISPVAGSALGINLIQAARVTALHKTDGKNSRVTVTRKVRLVNDQGRRTKKKAVKGSHYVIWDVRRINGILYYSTQSNLRYWLPASATKGTVQYKQGQKTIRLLTNGTTTYTKQTLAAPQKKQKKAKRAAKKQPRASKKTVRKASKKQATLKAVPIVSVAKKAYVYNAQGKKVKTYRGSKKYTSMIAGVKVNSLGSKTINGQKYYALEPGRYYVKADDFKVIK